MKVKTIAVLPGFGEGPWQVKRLNAALAKLGYAVEAAAKADVVVAHSAGCFFLPNTRENQLIILIGPPYWPGKSMFMCSLQKNHWDLVANVRRHNLKFWSNKVAHSLLYLLGDIRRTVTIIFKARKHNFYEALMTKPVAIIRNSHDLFCTPELQAKLPSAFFSFYELPGEHDDCWFELDAHARLVDSIVKKELHLNT